MAIPTESYILQTTNSTVKAPARRQGHRRSLLAALVAFCAVVLAACGADVNSRLELRSDYSGERLFVLTIVDSDVEALSGGIESAGEVLDSYSPDVLEFEGISIEDEGYRATFRMPFEDLEDYERKINALLDVSDVPQSERNMTVEFDDQALMTSLALEEDFYNDDLMNWAAEALIAEGVVSESATVFTSSGSATVTFEGQEVETSTSLPRMDFEITKDQRFEEVGLDFEILESGDVHIAMSYLVTPEHQQAQNVFLSEQVEQLQELKGLEGEVVDSGEAQVEEAGDTTRQIAATFTTAEAVTSGIQLLLANENATFDIFEQTAQGSPDTSVRYVAADWTCETICNPNNIQQLSGETLYPEHWDLTDERREYGDLVLEFNRGMPLDSLTSTTELQLGGDMTQSFEFVVDNKTQEGHEEMVAERFAPPEGAGSYDTTVRDTTTVYAVSFEASDATELTNLLNQYLETKNITEDVFIEHEPLSGIWATYELQADLSGIWELATGGVEGAALFEVTLPVMHTGDSDASTESGRTVVVDDASGAFSVSANGPTITTVWVVVIGLLLLAVLITLFIRTRKATSRVWAVAPDPSNTTRPYNIQGPRDDLTETDILASPKAPGPHVTQTSELADRPATQRTRRYGPTGRFPDVPVPSPTDYEKLREELERPEAVPEEQQPDQAGDSEPNKPTDTDSGSKGNTQ